MAEFEFIDWIRARTPGAAGVIIGPGDDCAVVRETDRPMLVTTDMLMEGVDFLGDTEPRRVGRKAMSANLSDIAAMGGVPRWAVVSVALPRRWNASKAEELYLGMRERADAFETAIIGGDTNAWDGPLVLSVTVMGETGPHGPILRKGAKPGDWLMVTGPLGGSIQGKHLDFLPRLHEAKQLQKACVPHAMIDISDGLSADLHHILSESGVGAVLNAAQIPIAAAARAMHDDRSPLEHALGDGEDFELLVAVAPEDGKRLLTLYSEWAWIGVCVKERGLYLEEGGRRRPIKPTGYVHTFGTEPTLESEGGKDDSGVP
jgi:thiamine-monophosphate kinase